MNQQRFFVDDLVKLSQAAKDRVIRKRQADYTGVVHSDPGAGLVYVVWQGCKREQAISRYFIERV